jgi:hypothetical protein
MEFIANTLRGIQTVFADGNREADASIRLRHSVANSHERRRGSHEVTIVRKTADNGFARGNSNQPCVYPGGNYGEDHGLENATLMDSTGTRDTHSRVMRI